MDVASKDQTMESVKKRKRLAKDELVVSSNEVEENYREQESSTTSSTRSPSNRNDSLRSELIKLSHEYPELDEMKEFPIIMQTLKFKQLKLENEEKCPLYKLPQDLFNKCLSFLDKSYGFVAPVSKHFNESYKLTFDGDTETRADFKGLSKEAGVYLMESIPHEFLSEEHKRDIGWYIYETDASITSFDGLSFTYTDYLIHKAARQGNLEVYKQYLENGYDLLRAQGKHWNLFRNLGEFGHLHILQYLKEQQSFFRGFCYSAIGASRGGHIDIIEWIQNEIGCFSNDTKDVSTLVDECVMEASEHGHIEVLKWLYENIEYIRFSPDRVIGSDNLDTIKFYIEKDPSTNYFAEEFEETIIETENIDIIKYFVENRFQFTTKSAEAAAKFDNVEVLKYLISIGIEWEFDDIESYFSYMDSFQLMKLRFEKERNWWTNASIAHCMRRESNEFSVEMLRYLHDNSCPWEAIQPQSVYTFLDTAMSFARNDILKYILQKMSDIPELKDDILFLALDNVWLEGFKYIMQNLEGCSLPSLNHVLHRCHDFDFFKFCKSQSMKWMRDASSAEIANEIEEIAIRKDWNLLRWLTSELDSNIFKNTHILKIAQYFDFRREVLQHLKNTGFSTDKALKIAIEKYTEVKAVKSLVEIGFKIDEDVFAHAIKSFDYEPTDKDLEILSFLVRKRCPQKKVFD